MTFEPAIVSSITALVAVIASPFATVYVANKNIKSSVVSKNRQDWINRLRNEIAELLKEMQHVPSAYAAQALTTEQAIERHGIILSKVEIIKLLINPKESDHEDLVRQISLASDKAIEAINHKKGYASELEKMSSNIVTISQTILKREWERVKSGD